MTQSLLINCELDLLIEPSTQILGRSDSYDCDMMSTSQ